MYIIIAHNFIIAVYLFHVHQVQARAWCDWNGTLDSVYDVASAAVRDVGGWCFFCRGVLVGFGCRWRLRAVPDNVCDGWSQYRILRWDVWVLVVEVYEYWWINHYILMHLLLLLLILIICIRQSYKVLIYLSIPIILLYILLNNLQILLNAILRRAILRCIILILILHVIGIRWHEILLHRWWITI